MRSIKEAFVGDTIYLEKTQVEPFEGFKTPKPMVATNIHICSIQFLKLYNY